LNFQVLYHDNFEFVWRTLQRMGVHERDVQDTCQKVFLVAFRRQAEFLGLSTSKTWLCGIAIRLASDYRRSAVQRRERLMQEPSPDMGAEPNQLDALEQRERLRELDAVLAELPEEQRTVLVLFELEELSGVDIAQALGVPEGTVRSRLRLARQAFMRIAAERRQCALAQAVGGAP
jgi:RNA polymerase sigma-70 factor (ECF subfamily)